MKNERKLAVIGVGPRGLYATEQLISRLSNKISEARPYLLLFEQTGNFGCGHVYDTNQVTTNWINISERILNLDPRPTIHLEGIKIPAFPSYHQWIDKDYSIIAITEPDIYPPRAKIGNYLQQRFETFIRPLVNAKMATLHTERVENVVVLENGKIEIKTKSNTYDSIDEVLLTIGHQPTERSEQILQWEKYSNDNEKVFFFKNSYPVERLLNCKGIHAKSTIGIRGLGLTMIDVVRGIATQFGEFKIVDSTTQKCEYNSTKAIHNLFVPFSLDGLPPSPKPLNEKLDSLYKPTAEQISTFEDLIGNANAQRKAESSDFLIDAITPIIAKVFTQLPQAFAPSKMTIQDIEQVTKEWLKNQAYHHPLIVSLKQTTQKMMQSFVGMATGKHNVSLDFCIGQVWRHCQPSIYKQLSFNECSAKVFGEIIKLDERMKRYSYGPPVESIQQMLALVSAGVMTLDFVNNPDIKLSAEGWKLKCEEESIIVTVMINSVLDAPEIKAVKSPIIKNLLSNDILQVVHDDFGVSTNEDGYLDSGDHVEEKKIALLGRLAKGTIIGVDAILQCFGNRPESWAAAAAKNWD